MHLLTDPYRNVDLDVLLDVRTLLKRLAVFFGGVIVDTDPEFDGTDVDREDIESGTSLLYDHLLRAYVADISDPADAERR